MSKEQFLARSRSYAEIREKGCVGSFNDGIEIETQGVRTRLVAWPGNGFQMHSVHVLTLRPGDASAMYQYDQGEEMLVCLKGSGEVYLRDKWVTIAPGDIAYILGGEWVPVNALEAAMAPCGVAHGGRPQSTQQASLVMGFGAPAQLDVYMKSDALYRDGRYLSPPSEVLDWPPK